MDRRSFFLRAGALAGVAGGLESLQAAQISEKEAKNIIWMVSDGMSPSVLPLAEQFSLRARGKGTIWQALIDRPDIVRGTMDMSSLDSIVTDSSSASSCWGSGARIFNAWVNMLPDGTKLTPIADIARGRKRLVGLVTTATVTHATPAGFAAVSRRRDDEHLIAEQYLDKVDVILGGGRKFFDSRRPDKTDWRPKFQSKGYEVVESRGAMLAAKSARLLGLFSDGHVPYTLDQRNSQKLQQEVPTLAEMTIAALGRLSKNKNGFLLQVEGARVDHAAHANDAAGLIWDQLAFDDAIEAVLKFAEKEPNTLVVITSDHGNSNPGLRGYGKEYRDTNMAFERLLKVKASFSDIASRIGTRSEYSMHANPEVVPKPMPPANRVVEALRAYFGISPGKDEIDFIRRVVGGQKGLMLNRDLDKLDGVLGTVVGNHTGVCWMATSHTSDYVLVTALGPGARRFEGFIRNTEVFPALAALMGSNFRNPSMPAEKAQQFRQVAMLGRRDRPDWA
ncbi:MAG: alkaline phosphatase [Bryobacteraceae bacterium]|nr:alkaline phosphatase [Bryobacteraceae bacterium]